MRQLASLWRTLLFSSLVAAPSVNCISSGEVSPAQVQETRCAVIVPRIQAYTQELVEKKQHEISRKMDRNWWVSRIATGCSVVALGYLLYGSFASDHSYNAPASSSVSTVPLDQQVAGLKSELSVAHERIQDLGGKVEQLWNKPLWKKTLDLLSNSFASIAVTQAWERVRPRLFYPTTLAAFVQEYTGFVRSEYECEGELVQFPRIDVIRRLIRSCDDERALSYSARDETTYFIATEINALIEHIAQVQAFMQCVRDRCLSFDYCRQMQVVSVALERTVADSMQTVAQLFESSDPVADKKDALLHQLADLETQAKFLIVDRFFQIEVSQNW